MSLDWKPVPGAAGELGAIINEETNLWVSMRPEQVRGKPGWQVTVIVGKFPHTSTLTVCREIGTVEEVQKTAARSIWMLCEALRNAVVLDKCADCGSPRWCHDGAEGGRCTKFQPGYLP